MKFAKELDENAVPEWKAKYLDYKQGKKKLKAVARAIRNVDRGTPAGRLDSRPSPFGSSSRDAPVVSMLNRGRDLVNRSSPRNNLQNQRTRSAFAGSAWQAQSDLEQGVDASAQPSPINERSPLRQAQTQEDGRPGRMARYGSIIGTPPGESSPAMERLTQQRTAASSLALPDPALDPRRSKDHQNRDEFATQDPETPPAVSVQEEQSMPHPPQSQLSHTGDAYKIGKPVDGPLGPQASHGASSRLSHARRTHTFPHFGHRPAFLKRVFSSRMNGNTATNSLREHADVALESYREVDFRKAEFFIFLDGQLEKIDSFYVEKEKEATDRLNVLREQLHIMRDRRNDELAAAEGKRKREANDNLDSRPGSGEDSGQHANANGKHDHGVRDSVAAQFDSALDKVRAGHLGKTSKAMRDLGTPNFRLDPTNLDFTRKQHPDGISYRTAKHKLKTALVEFYRGLELLKNYALLNRTAFRKITKKADKTIPWTADNGAPGREYMIERVNHAKFVTGDEIDTLMQTTEDYYARYFERGNRKMAISKLRSKHYKALDYHAAFFRAGLFGAAGMVLSLLAVIEGAKINFSPNHYLAEEAGYLLQIYGGYFLLLLATFLFCLGCREFARYKVNYHFILELNTRNSLNWRQLCEIPAFFFLLQGLVMYLNFSWVGGDTMFVYWPVLLIGLAAVILLAPIPQYYWKSRYWFAEALWRLMFSGVYPVQFKDLFLGDMMCSQTYAFGNVVLFFCLYARNWSDPPQCNSGHSMLFGFFTTLPAIFRLAQCLRRYGDTWAAFPHLANAGKYTCTILSYMTLSLFRLDKSYERLAVFTAFSAINSIYCSVWDVIMDFSLGDPSAKHKFLRKELQYEYYWYYIAMVVDPILRFNWVFYVIFAFDVQHASLNSFCIALSEVLRRGMWTMIRIENEHCTNVRFARATMNPSMPFAEAQLQQQQEQQRRQSGVDVLPEGGILHTDSREESRERDGDEGSATGADRFRQGVRRVQSHQQKQKESPAAQTFKRVGHIMAAAHAFDYERKKPPGSVKGDGADEDEDDDDDDDDDDDEVGR